MMKTEDDLAANGGLDSKVGHLIRVAEQVHTALWFQQVSRTVTSPQFAVLETLSENPGLDQRTLGKIVSLRQATLTDVIQRLAGRGEIERWEDPRDRRRKILKLTAKGRAVVMTLAPRAEAVSDLLLSSIPDAERDRFVGLLGLLANHSNAPK
ncbi:MarR family winged helix-turn-helix transcriptional regulator [Nocardia sp. NPDC052278]|uniref:MarR family winged helix-turn-helix transcriptional regulator n=1 Tax=unclassified Nocardia TaxID=2637762 RepID=UPI0036A4ABC1